MRLIVKLVRLAGVDRFRVVKICDPVGFFKNVAGVSSQARSEMIRCRFSLG